MPKIHMKSLVTWGGGGGGDPAQAVTAAATQAEDDSVTAADASSATQEELADQAAQAEADRVSAWQASQAQSDEISQSATDMQQASIQDPTSLITTPDVATIDPNAAGTTVDAGTGQLTDPAPQVTDPTAFNAAAVNPVTAAGQVAPRASAPDGGRGDSCCGGKPATGPGARRGPARQEATGAARRASGGGATAGPGPRSGSEHVHRRAPSLRH